jgi:HemY protein
MIRYSIFLVILIAAIAATVWLVSHPGEVMISWLGWHLDTYVPVLIGAIAAVAAFSTFATLLIRALIRLPKNISKSLSDGSERRKEQKAAKSAKEESKHLFAGFAAAWAGNQMAIDKLFDKYWKKTIVSTNNETAIESSAEILQLLLFAKCSEDRGDVEKAVEAYRKLLLFTDVPRDFGIDEKTIHLAAYKGLIECDHSEARKLDYACAAFSIAPEVDWTAKHVVALQIKTNQWAEAYNTLRGEVPASMNAGRYSAAKLKEYIRRAFGADEYNKVYAMTALQMVEEVEKANAGDAPVDVDLQSVDVLELAKDVYNHDSSYVPAIVILSQQYSKAGKAKKAVSVLVEAWKTNPDMDIASAYMNLFEGDKNADKLRHAEKLTEANSDHKISLLFLADIGFSINSWEYGREKMELYVQKYGMDDTVMLSMSKYASEHNEYNSLVEWLEKHAV